MEPAELAAARRRGFGAAYRMLGSVAEAEDVAQEAVLRLARAEQEIENPQAWITTAATRLSIDVLRSARVRRETYVGPWLPEPLIGDAAADDESFSQAFLVLLERLTPVERAAFLLREVFEYDYERIARVVERSEANARQLVARARKHVQAGRRRFEADAQVHDRLLERFVAAAEEGDLEQLEAMLAEDAAFYSDGGGRISAARKPLFGAARIARAWGGIMALQRRHADLIAERAIVNGRPGRILRTPDGRTWGVLTVDVVGEQIAAVRIVRNPDKLAHTGSGGRPRS